MTRIEKFGDKLTSNGDGDATATIECPPGIIHGVLVVNVAATKPSDNWDLTMRNKIATGGGTSVNYDLLVDETVTQTAAAYYLPTLEGNLPTDGSAQTLTEMKMASFGDIYLIGANMGATKDAYVYVLLEH